MKFQGQCQKPLKVGKKHISIMKSVILTSVLALTSLFVVSSCKESVSPEVSIKSNSNTKILQNIKVTWTGFCNSNTVGYFSRTPYTFSNGVYNYLTPQVIINLPVSIQNAIKSAPNKSKTVYFTGGMGSNGSIYQLPAAPAGCVLPRIEQMYQYELIGAYVL